MGEVHEDLVVKLAHMIDGFVERNVERLSSAHRVVESNPHKKRSFADAMARNDDSDIPAAKPAVDRVFEQSKRVAFVKFLPIHAYSSSTPRPQGSSRCRTS